MEHVRPLLMPILTMAVLTIGGALLVRAFGDGDREIILYTFIASLVIAGVWLAARGIPRSSSGWLVPIAIAFGPAYLLAAYIAVILSTPPGQLGAV